MTKSHGDSPIQQDQFEEAVLAVVGTVLRTDQRVDLAADDRLAEGALPHEAPDLRADLILCAAECLRLMTTLPGGRHLVTRNFPAFVTACRSISPIEDDGTATSRKERALRRFTVGLLDFRRDQGKTCAPEADDR